MAVRRIKTYTGETGRVYQYYFVGERPSLPQEASAPATEYVFDVSTDSKITFAVSVFLPRDAVESWAQAHGRGLTDAERYAAAKVRLLQGFDQTPDMLQDGRHLAIEAADLEGILASLGRD